MKMTPEGKVKARVRRRLAECPIPVYLFMPVQNGMGEATLDFIGCINGQFFAIETKAGRSVMTPRQVATAHRILGASGMVFVLNEDPATWQLFEQWLVRETAIAALEAKEGVAPVAAQRATDIRNEES